MSRAATRNGDACAPPCLKALLIVGDATAVRASSPSAWRHPLRGTARRLPWQSLRRPLSEWQALPLAWLGLRSASVGAAVGVGSGVAISTGACVGAGSGVGVAAGGWVGCGSAVGSGVAGAGGATRSGLGAEPR